MTTGTGSKEKWTPFADEVITTLYATQGIRACQNLLPGRSITAIKQRAHKLREIGRQKQCAARERFGTPTDDRPDEIKALDMALRCFRECEPAANLVASLGVAA